MGPKAAIAYALASVVMLGVAVTMYWSYFEFRRSELRAEAAFTEELKSLLGKRKRESIDVANAQMAVLRHEIEILPTISSQDKDRLSYTISNINNNLTEATRVSTDTSGIASPEVKLGFALAAFALITSVIIYCLWMIARPTMSAADRNWAKELLNKQLVFLGGLVVGIVLR